MGDKQPIDELLKKLEESEAAQKLLQKKVIELENELKLLKESGGTQSFSALLDRSRRTFEWSTVSSLPDITSLCSATVFEDKVYVAATKTECNPNHKAVSLLFLSPANCLQKWDSIPTPPGTSQCQYLFTYNGSLYLLASIGSDNSLQLWRNQQGADQLWVSIATAPSAAVKSIAATVSGDLLLLAGGLDVNGTSLNSVHVYNLASGKWQQWCDLPQCLSSASLAVFEGELLVFGGRTRIGNVLKGDSRYVYSVKMAADGNWREHACSLHPLYSPGVLSLDGQIVTVGGRSDEVSSSVLCWNNQSRTWQHLPRLSTAQAHPSLVFCCADGHAKLVAVGGFYEGLFACGVVQILSLD